jgi:hypothetical protein
MGCLGHFRRIQLLTRKKRSMLARLAATLRGRQGGADGGGLGAGPGEGASVVLDDNCLVCLLR